MTTATATQVNGEHSAAPTTATAAAVVQPQPLWGGQKIEVIGITGEFGMGKTLFGLTIDPLRTLTYDNEGSSANYEGLGFQRVDVAVELMRAYPRGYKPIDRYLWWLKDVRSRATAGRYSVILVDPVSEIESGLADWVWDNPREVGYTLNQFEKSNPLYWGAVKEYWKGILDDLRVRCQTFAFTAHMRDKFAGGSPTGKREAKGKETLFELASLYLELERKPDARGNVPDTPSAKVLKSRVCHARIVDGKPVVQSILPPRLPIATPDAIRAYIAKPADYTKLKAAERVAEEEFTEQERLRLQAKIAEDTATAATAELTRQEKMEAAARRQAEAAANAAQPKDTTHQVAAEKVEKAAASVAVVSPSTVETNPAETISAADAQAIIAGRPCSVGIAAEIRSLLAKAFDPKRPEEVRAEIYRHNKAASKLADLTQSQAEAMLASVKRLIEIKAAPIQSTEPAAESAITREQVDKIRELFMRLEIPPDVQEASLRKRKVNSVLSLTYGQAKEIIGTLEPRLEKVLKGDLTPSGK